MMPDLIAYVLHGHDNESYMLKGAAGLIRCATCGELLDRPRLVDGFRLKKRQDVSATYDGYTIASKRFVENWEELGGTGLAFAPLPAEAGYFAVDADYVVEFDAKRRKTRFVEYRPCCKRFHSVAGATPAFLKNPENLSITGAVKTDVMFGSGDEKHPLLIVPLGIGNLLKRANLSGLELSEVRE